MWCFACCCFPQHPSSAYQDPWVFQHLRYSHFSKFSTLSSCRIRGPTRYEIARHLLVWAYHEWCERLYLRRACKALFFPEISSQNTAAAFCISCVFCEKWLLGCRDSHPQFRGSSLGTPGTFGARTIHLATKYDEERLAFLNSSFPTEARVKSLDCALFCFKARKIRLQHEGSAGRSTRRSRLVATEHRYLVFF